MDPEALDWEALDRLRRAFLNGTAGASDYWESDRDLLSYNSTFAQRIGWKWDFVLGELSRRGWRPPPGEILDWGCGTGIAGRAFLDHFGQETVTGVRLWDRSLRAMTWASEALRSKRPGLPIHHGFEQPPAVLLISHVLTELRPDQTEALTEFAAGAKAVLWVEPGTYEASLTLVAVRERLRGRLNLVGPCTHSERCGLLAPGNERHWCHHFAPPPPEVFTDGDWARFGAIAGIDLRSLPLSWLAFDHRPALALPPKAYRVIGRPRVYKAHALVLGCDSSGVAERTVMKRHDPEAFRRHKKGTFASLDEGQ
jgi:hypothetical protein